MKLVVLLRFSELNNALSVHLKANKDLSKSLMIKGDSKNAEGPFTKVCGI